MSNLRYHETYKSTVSIYHESSSKEVNGTLTKRKVSNMTDPKKSQEAFGECCSGPGFKFPEGKSKEMSRMMDKFCGEGSSFDCSAMTEKFRGEDGSMDCGEMMKTMQKMFGSDPEEKESE